jgi:hypothetical protein
VCPVEKKLWSVTKERYILKRLKKIALSVLVAAALAFGVTVGGSTVAAQPAQAYSGSYDYYTYAWCHIYYYKWRDYSWWEEFWYFKKDGYEIVAIERYC